MRTYRRCLTCLEIPEREIYQCTNGHIVCNFCVEKLSNCSQCSLAYNVAKVRNRALEEEMDRIDFECKFKERGCDETCKRAAISVHTKSCCHNPDYVPLCEWMGYSDCKFSVGSTSRTEILSHFIDIHGSDAKGCANVKMNISGFITNDNVPSVILPLIISPDDITSETSPLFLLHGKINSPPGFVSWICIHLWDGELPRKKYQAAFSFTSDCSTFSQEDNDQFWDALEEDPLLLSWTTNAYSTKMAKYVLESSPVNIPVQLLLDSIFSPERGVYIDVKISPVAFPNISAIH